METARLSHEITASILQALVNCFYSQYSKVMDGFIRYTDPALNEVSAPILLRTHPFMAMQSIAGHRPVTFRCHCFFFLGGRFDRPAAPIAVHLSLNVSSIGGRIDPKILEAYRLALEAMSLLFDDFGYELIRRMRSADRSRIPSAAPKLVADVRPTGVGAGTACHTGPPTS